jgi:MFS family permease
MSALTPLATRRRETSHESGQAPSARLHRRGFWLVGYVFLVTMAFSTVPTPLYVLYGARDHFGPLMVTVIFAAYAVGVVASLFLAGHLSDWLGRRRMALTAVAVNLAAGLIFLLWPTVPGLLLARVVTGVSIGMMTATATAFLSELDAAAHGGLPRRRAEIAATAANLGGLGVGPLVSGFLAQYAGDPLQVPYLVFEALMLLAMLALALVGLFTSLAPGFIAGTLHHPSHALAGFAVFAVFGAAALTQIAVSRATLRGQLAFGFSLLILGLVMVTAAVWAASLLLLILGGVIAGCGVGAAFRGSVSTVLAIAAPGARGEALAGLFLAAYLGLAIPVVALGVATQLLSVRDAVLGFAVVLAAVVALVSRRLLSRPHEASPANASPANASTADASTAKASAGEPAQWGQPSSVRRAS